jgi:hypothetical protein
MKKLNQTIAMVSLLSLTSCLVPEKAVEISEKIGVSGLITYPNTESHEKSEKENKDQFDPVNSKYTEKDFAGCFTAIAIAPVVLIAEGLTNALTFKKNVDAYINKKTIDLVSNDLNEYISKNGKISPENFWVSLSAKAYDSLISDLIPTYNTVSTNEFNEKKKIIAYAFLYYLEAGTPETTYLFTFDDRESSESRIIREYISFAGSNKIKDAKDVGICGYFRFSDINIESRHDQNDDVKSKILCGNKFGTKVILAESDNGELRVELTFKNAKPRVVKMNSSDVEIDVNKSNVELEYSRGWRQFPKVYIEIDKRFKTFEDGQRGRYEVNSAKSMDIQIKYNLIKAGDKLKNLTCREVKAFSFE